jgi:recombination associated protein RdgC
MTQALVYCVLFFPEFMRFKNLLVFRLDAKWNVEARVLEKILAGRALQPCNSFEMESHGWMPRQPGDPFLYTLDRHWLLTLGVEQKILPASVVRQVAMERAAGLAVKQGHTIGRKQMREIRERVLDELLPRALTRRLATAAWIDAANRWFVVDTVAETRAARLLETLRKSGYDFPAERLDTQLSPAAAMTGWLANGEISPDFTIDQDLELRAGDANKATVRYVRHGLSGKDIQAHIASGKTATRLGLTWKDRISFVLTENLQIKRVAFLNVLKPEAGPDADDKDAQFGLDFALMTGELSLLLADLVKLLGGEKNAPA